MDGVGKIYYITMALYGGCSHDRFLNYLKWLRNHAKYFYEFRKICLWIFHKYILCDF